MTAATADLRRAAHTAFERGDAARLDRACRALLDASPEDAEARRILGRAALRDFRPDLAERWFREAAARAPDAAGSWSDLARSLIELRREAEAEAILAAASARGVRSASLLTLLGFLRGALGRVDDARTAFEAALDADASWAEAYRGLAATNGLTRGDPLHRQLTRLLDEGAIDPTSEASAHYALAEADRLAGDAKGFFVRLIEANKRQLARAPAPSERGDGAYRRAARCYSQTSLECAARAPDAAFTPIFIVGAPYSGGAAIEAALGQRPGVQTCGELPYLRGAVARALGTRTGKPAPEGFETLSSEALTELAAEYVGRVRRIAPEARFVTDAAPDNDRLIGVILVLFPNAKIIRAQRDPMAVGLETFRRPALAPAPHNCDLAAIGKRLHHRERLDDRLARIAPGAVLCVDNDALAARPVETLEAIRAHCGLDEGGDAIIESAPRIRPSSLLATAGEPELPDHAWRQLTRELEPLRRSLGRVRAAR